MRLQKTRLLVLAALGLLLGCGALWAQDDPNCNAACQAARKAANPLADVRAIMTDNTVAFNSGTNDEDSYNFQLQPVYALPLQGANLVLRGIIPIQGIQQGAVLPPDIVEPSRETDLKWGLGDSTLQAFYAPTPGESGIAVGYGLQVSFPTATREALQGAEWGAGPAFVIFGQTGDLSWGAVAAHMWGQDDFSVSILQPILTYGLGDGAYIGYNNVVSYNWNAADGDEPWQIPLGLMAGKTFIVDEQGTALDLNLGYYAINQQPTGGPDSQLKFGISLFF